MKAIFLLGAFCHILSSLKFLLVRRLHLNRKLGANQGVCDPKESPQRTGNGRAIAWAQAQSLGKPSAHVGAQIIDLTKSRSGIKVQTIAVRSVGEQEQSSVCSVRFDNPLLF